MNFYQAQKKDNSSNLQLQCISVHACVCILPCKCMLIGATMGHLFICYTNTTSYKNHPHSKFVVKCELIAHLFHSFIL